MPVTTTLPEQYTETFSRLSTDDKLAVLWYVYEAISRESRLEDPNNNTAPDNSSDLFDRIKGISQDDQLQLMRDLLEEKETDLTRAYYQLSNTTRIAFWYQLGQGMENSEVIGMPEDYELSADAKELVSELTATGFEQQYVFMRSALLSDDGKSSV